MSTGSASPDSPRAMQDMAAMQSKWMPPQWQAMPS